MIRLREQPSRTVKRARPVVELTSDDETDEDLVPATPPIVTLDNSSASGEDERKTHKRKRKSVKNDVAKPVDPVILLDDSSSASEEERSKAHRPTRRAGKEVTGEPGKPPIKLAPIFLSRKERLEGETQAPPKKTQKNSMSEATRNFLYSGVPDVIAKAQKAYIKNVDETEAMEKLDCFPLCTSNVPLSSLSARPVDFRNTGFTSKPELDEAVNSIQIKVGLPPMVDREPEQDWSSRNFYPGDFCCGPTSELEPSDRLLKIIEQGDHGDNSEDRLPWVVKYKPKKVKHLVVKTQYLKTFRNWLKQWRRDIKDDGGTRRKIEKKRKKIGSDDEFIDDRIDEEIDAGLKNKSVVLYGPTGSGKTAMIYLVAKIHDFEVVEINFSSRRSGQDVLRNVEEATLSHRLAHGLGVNKKDCLVLIKDIDQAFPAEDEGFYSALAQLITASCRPIVMTITATHADHPIDKRIEKTEPLWIPIDVPSSSAPIVSSVLFPIIRKEIRKRHGDYDLKKEPRDKEFIGKILDSIVRHCGRDIKKSINQTQILWSSSTFNLMQVHHSLCPKFDLGFVIPIQEKEDSSEDKPKKSTQKDMDEIAKNLEFLTDLDQSIFTSIENPIEDNVTLDVEEPFGLNFLKMLEKYQHQSDSAWSRINLFRSLAFRNDQHVSDLEKSEDLLDNVEEFFHRDMDYETWGYIRTIVKASVIKFHERKTRRVQAHFSRMNVALREAMCDNFDFEKLVRVAKETNHQLD